MYEENLTPLADGDFAVVFADLLARIGHGCQATSPAKITPRNVVQWARSEVQPYLASICRRLLLPGSAVFGTERLAELTRRALQGHSCIVCLNHRSNLDVPTLHALLEDRNSSDLFDRIVWIAGRKLQEDIGATRMLVEGINRVIVTPRSWMTGEHSVDEWRDAHQINIAAQRAIHELRHQGWVFAIFPTATRVRPNNGSTTRAIEEIDSYLKHFEFMQLGRIDGCTLPVSLDRNLTHETPVLDRVRYSFGAIRRTDHWRASVAERYPELDQRTASALAIIEDIDSLDSSGVDDP